jgi:hypothetical protein
MHWLQLGSFLSQPFLMLLQWEHTCGARCTPEGSACAIPSSLTSLPFVGYWPDVLELVRVEMVHEILDVGRDCLWIWDKYIFPLTLLLIATVDLGKLSAPELLVRKPTIDEAVRIQNSFSSPAHGYEFMPEQYLA